MRRLMERILDRYGVVAKIQSGSGGMTLKVLFHSINSFSWQNMERMFSPLGEVPRGQYICVLPVKIQLEAGHSVLVNGREYLVRKVELMSLFSGPVYYWALCVEKGCEDTWGSGE